MLFIPLAGHVQVANSILREFFKLDISFTFHKL